MPPAMLWSVSAARIASTADRQRASSAAFSATWSASGYLSFGNGAMGQSKAGMSSLWIA